MSTPRMVLTSSATHLRLDFRGVVSASCVYSGLPEDRHEAIRSLWLLVRARAQKLGIWEPGSEIPTDMKRGSV